MLPKELGSCSCHKSEFRPNIQLFSIFSPISAHCCIPWPTSCLIWTRPMSVSLQYKVCLLHFYKNSESATTSQNVLLFPGCPRLSSLAPWLLFYQSLWVLEHLASQNVTANDHKGTKNISLLFCACCSKGLTQWLQKAHLSVAKAGGSVHWGTWITQAKIFKYPCLGTIFLSQQLHISSLFVRFLERLRLFNVQWASHSKINSEMLICVSPTF